MSHTYGMEFETVGLTTRMAANAITHDGVRCSSQGYNHDTTDTWKAVPDGSLQGDAYSAEIVSPILNDERLNEARTVSRALLKAGARVNTSTGFHVHMGYEQIGLQSLSRLVVNYYTAHPIFAKMVAPSRTANGGSRWCKVLTLEQAHDTADRLNNIINLNSFNNFDRYFSLNLNSIARHGTIEFRLHQGTLNGTKALAWVNFLTSMVNFSMSGLMLNEALYHGTDGVERITQLPDLLAKLRDYGLTDSVNDYLLRRADELAERG